MVELLNVGIYFPSFGKAVSPLIGILVTPLITWLFVYLSWSIKKHFINRENRNYIIGHSNAKGECIQEHRKEGIEKELKWLQDLTQWPRIKKKTTHYLDPRKLLWGFLSSSPTGRIELCHATQLSKNLALLLSWGPSNENEIKRTPQHNPTYMNHMK